MFLFLDLKGYGLRKNITEKCDAILKININKDINSLNVSNACAISLYELHKKKPPVNKYGRFNLKNIKLEFLFNS